MNLNDSKTKRWNENRKCLLERDHWRVQKGNFEFQTWEETNQENEKGNSLELNKRSHSKILIGSSWWEG